MINSDETHLKENSHILHELTEGFDNNDKEAKTINKNFKKLSLIYHPDKNPENLAQAEEKFKALTAFNTKITDANNKAETIADLKKQYPNSSLNFLSSNAFVAELKPVTKKTEDKPFDPIKPEDKNFFESFKRNYYQKSFAILDAFKFNDQGLEKCFVSFKNREYSKFVKSKNNSTGAIEFKDIKTFDRTTYESYIFFPDQLNPETPGHDQVILESYKQAVSENKIAKPDDLSHPEKPSQDKAGDEYNFLNFKDDFIRSYTTANQKTGKNTNPNYLTDRLRDRIEIFTGKKTKDDIEPKAPEKPAPIKNEQPKDYQARVLKYNSNLETYEISYAEYQALNSKFDELCKNDNVKTFLDKEKTKYLQEKEAQERKLKEAKEAEERELKEKENSIEERWSRFSKSLLKLQEDASSQLVVVSSSIADASSKIAGVGSSIADASSKIAGVSSEIGSSLGSASSAVHGFSSNLAESAKKEVGSLAMTISTSATTTFTQVSSTAMSWLVSIKLPQINLPSTETNAQKNNKTIPETQEQAEERVKEAINKAIALSLRAQKEAKKATPAPVRRTSSASASSRATPPATPANTSPTPPSAPISRANSVPSQKPGPQDTRIAFFGPATKKHSANPDNKPKPEPNGPSRPTASTLRRAATQRTPRK